MNSQNPVLTFGGSIPTNKEQTNLFLSIAYFFTIFLHPFIFIRLFEYHFLGLGLIFNIIFLVALVFTNKNHFLIQKTPFLLFVFLTSWVFFNGLFLNVELKRLVYGYYHTFLFFFVWMVFYNIHISYNNFIRILKIISIFFTLLIFIGYIESFLLEPKTYHEIGILRFVKTIFPNGHSYFWTMNAMNIILLLTLYQHEKKKYFLYLIAFTFFSMTLTFSRKSIIASIIILTVYMFFVYQSRFKAIIGAFILLMMSIFLMTFGFEVVQYFLRLEVYASPESYDEHARTMLTLTSFDIASSNFPFGSGLGTFASKPASVWYSPLYYEYSLDILRGMSEDSFGYSLDSHIPHIIGEFGFIGAILFTILWGYPMIISFLKLTSKNNEIRLMSFFIFATFFEVFIEGFGSQTPERLYWIYIYAGLGAIAYKLIKSRSEPGIQ